MKETHLAVIIAFESEKDLTRFEYLKRFPLIFFILVLAHFLYPLISHHDIPTRIKWTVEILIAGLTLIWILTSKIIKQIHLNYVEQKFVIHYLTPFHIDRKFEVPFAFLNYQFDKEPSLRQPKKWVLKIFNNKHKVLTMETGRDGFSQQTLESIVKHLEDIKHETTSQN